MRIRSLAAALVVALLCSATASYAEWLVEKATQPAKYSTDGQTWTPISDGMTVPKGSTIFTGPRGRALLKRGADTVMFAPNTVAAIVDDPQGGFRADIVQKVGRLILEVETRDRPHTRVRTPFLAAVVKGTQFEVQVGRESALVSVTSGVVEVTDLRRGERVNVQARQSVFVSRTPAEPLRLQGRGRKSPIERVAPAEPEITPFGSERGETAEPSGVPREGTAVNSSVAAREREAAGRGALDGDEGGQNLHRQTDLPGSNRASDNASARGESRRGDSAGRGRQRAEDAGSAVGGAGAGRDAGSREGSQARGSGRGRGAENRAPDASDRGSSGSRSTLGGDNRATKGDSGQNAGGRPGGQGHGHAGRPDAPAAGGNSGSQASRGSDNGAGRGGGDRGGNASDRAGPDGAGRGKGGGVKGSDQEARDGGGGPESTANGSNDEDAEGSDGRSAASTDRGDGAGD